MTFFEAFATLFSFAALLISLATYYYSDKRMRRANLIMIEANKKLEEANTIARNVLLMHNLSTEISIEAHKISTTPNFIGNIYCIYVAQIENEQSDAITIQLVNTVHSKAIVKAVRLAVGSFYLGPQIENFPVTVGLKGDVFLPIRIDSRVRKSLIEHLTPKSEGNKEVLENLFEELVTNLIKESKIFVEYADNRANGYFLTLEYDLEKDMFVGEPREVLES